MCPTPGKQVLEKKMRERDHKKIWAPKYEIKEGGRVAIA